MSDDPIIRTAEFNPKVKVYWLLSGIIICLVTIIGIPFLLVWLPIALFLVDRWLKAMECTLTSRNLVLKKGVLNRLEKTVPLEKITDLAMAQGPIMRALGLHRLSVETAGTSGPGALVSVVGIVDAPAFRQDVLDQRDKLARRDREDRTPAGGETLPSESLALLTEIRDTLRAIEKKLPGG